MKKSKCVLTHIWSQSKFKDTWVSYYSKHFRPEDMYILKINEYGIHPDWHTINRPVVAEQARLLQEYEYVLYCDMDEIVCHPMGIGKYMDCLEVPCVACNGYEVVQDLDEEAFIDWSMPILPQRKYWYPCKLYSKPLVSRIPLDWHLGFHSAVNASPPVDPDLILLHLHKIDFRTALQHNLSNAADPSKMHSKFNIEIGGYQNQLNEEGLRDWWDRSVDDYQRVSKTEMPGWIRELGI